MLKIYLMFIFHTEKLFPDLKSVLTKFLFKKHVLDPPFLFSTVYVWFNKAHMQVANASRMSTRGELDLIVYWTPIFAYFMNLSWKHVCHVVLHLGSENKTKCVTY